MNNSDFTNIYSSYLAHKWVTSKDKTKAEQQKRAEQAYNKKYYEEHRNELLRKARAGSGTGGSRPLTREEATAKLNQQIEDLDKYYKLNPQASMADQIAERKLIQQGMSKEDAREQVRKDRVSQLAKDAFTDLRNARASSTAIAKGKDIRKSYDATVQKYKDTHQKATLLKRSTQDTNASIAQAQAAKTRRSNFTSTENKIKRSINRSVKKVANIINGTKASVQKATDYYNNTKASINRITDFTKKTINKYFG